jgi:hypothetical protein
MVIELALSSSLAPLALAEPFPSSRRRSGFGSSSESQIARLIQAVVLLEVRNVSRRVRAKVVCCRVRANTVHPHYVVDLQFGTAMSTMARAEL